MDDTHRFPLAMFKLKGGVSIFGKWIKTPTWGPVWLNPVKVMMVVGVAVLIYLSIDAPTDENYLWGIIGISSLLGIVLVLPIGGADMPVVVSLFNSLSELQRLYWFHHRKLCAYRCRFFGGRIWAHSHLHHVQGDEPNATRCLFKSFGGSGEKESLPYKGRVDPDEVAMMLDGAQKVIIVPGYGMAVSNANTKSRNLQISSLKSTIQKSSTHSPSSWSNAWSHERALGRSKCTVRTTHRNG